MEPSNWIQLILAGCAVIYVIYKQLQPKEVRQNARWTLPIALLVIGAVNFIKYIRTNTLSPLTWGTIAISFLILALGMGALRAYTMKIWLGETGVLRKGTWVTVVLWIVSTGLHLVLEYIGHSGTETMLLYLALTIIAQKVVILARANALVHHTV